MPNLHPSLHLTNLMLVANRDPRCCRLFNAAAVTAAAAAALAPAAGALALHAYVITAERNAVAVFDLHVINHSTAANRLLPA
jgi:hypothetical protein